MPENNVEYIEHVFEFTATKGQKPVRLDVYLTNYVESATRNKVQKAIEDGLVTVNGKIAKSNKKVQPLDHIVCKIMKPPPIQLTPEDIPINVVYEDDYYLIVNKPAGMVSHPGFGNRNGTLVNALLWHLGVRDAINIESDDNDEDEESDEGQIYSSDAVRPGLVHRLDKDTSGLLVISKNIEIHNYLSGLFKKRTIDKTYYALVWGKLDNKSGTIETNIGRSKRNRKIFEVQEKTGKHSITDYEVIDEFENTSLLKVKLRTGRTHQIRVHMSYIKHPIFGDPVYGGDKIIYNFSSNFKRKFFEKLLSQISRQMLHAKSLGFIHPVSKEQVFYDSELPDDFAFILNQLKTFSNQL